MTELVKVGSDQGKTAVRLPYQLEAQQNIEKVLTFVADGSIPSSLLQSNNDVFITIPQNSIGLCKDMTLAVTFAIASAAVKLCPVPWMFSKITFYCDSGSTEMCYLYPHSILQYLDTFDNDTFSGMASDLLMNEQGGNLYNQGLPVALVPKLR